MPHTMPIGTRVFSTVTADGIETGTLGVVASGGGALGVIFDGHDGVWLASSMRDDEGRRIYWIDLVEPVTDEGGDDESARNVSHMRLLVNHINPKSRGYTISEEGHLLLLAMDIPSLAGANVEVLRSGRYGFHVLVNGVVTYTFNRYQAGIVRLKQEALYQQPVRLGGD